MKDTTYQRHFIYYLLTVNSQEQIIITTNKNNSQGDQTLDINKDTINIKESACWMWLCALVATGKAAASMKDLWNLRPEAGHPEPDLKLPLSPSARQNPPFPSVFWLLLLGCRHHTSLGSKSWVGHALEETSVHSLRRGSEDGGGSSARSPTHSSFQPSFLLPVPPIPGYGFEGFFAFFPPCLYHLLAFQKL